MAIRENKPNKIVVHHTANASLAPQFAGVDILHRQRFNFISSLGKFCGYHYLVERNGVVEQGRADTDEGAHCIGQNLQSIGIALAGNFDFQKPTAAQRNALVKLMDEKIAQHGISGNAIHPHRAFAATSCYGIGLSDSWARDTYASYKAQGLDNKIWLLRELVEKLTLLLTYAKK